MNWPKAVAWGLFLGLLSMIVALTVGQTGQLVLALVVFPLSVVLGWKGVFNR